MNHAASGTRRQAGFTLLELLVAVALMAVLAVLTWRGTDSVLRSRDQITGHTNETRALAVLFSQLDEDFRRAWPVRLMGLERAPVAFARDTVDGPLRIDLLREAANDAPVLLEHVVYRYRGGLIERGFEPWLRAGVGDVVGDALDGAGMVWQPILADVDVFEWRGWVEGGRAWQSGEALIPLGGAEQNLQAGAQPIAISGIELSIQRHGERLTRMFALGD